MSTLPDIVYMMDKSKTPDELGLAQEQLAFLLKERDKLAAELIIVGIERDYETVEKEKLAAELLLAHTERVFQHDERDKRAAELLIANIERNFQIQEKEKRAAELTVANAELQVQNREKEVRAAELIIANQELAFQNTEKEKRAAELVIANKELIFQSREKEKRAAELISAYKELAFQNQEIELNRKKDEFIGVASHELKTPLTSINAYLQFLHRRLEDSENKGFVTKALKQVRKLTDLISDLLDVSKIEAGKLTLNLGMFDLSELTTEVIELMGHQDQTHAIQQVGSRGPLLIMADRQRIEQVMINLITNAIKYSPHADTIIISLAQTSTHAIVSVQDFGMGIKENQQSRIFSRFYRSDDMDPQISGLGIGLYICDDIISRHQGILGVESKIGVGSTFSFKIPRNGKA